MQRMHAHMIEDTLGDQLIGHLSRDSTAMHGSPLQKRTPVKPKNKPGRPPKGEVRAAPEPSPLERQRTQTLQQMLFELDTACASGTKKNAKGYKIQLEGLQAVPRYSRTHQVDACYELMDAAYCSTLIPEEIQAARRVPLIEHNPRSGEKREFAPHEAQRYKTRSGAERCNARLRDEFGARQVQVRGHAKVMCHLMLGVLALCADQFTRLLV